MPAQPSLGANRKKLWVYVFTLASFAIFLAPSVKATAWKVTVKLDQNNALTYEVDPPTGGCPFPIVQNARDLRICDGDTVQWQAMFPGPHTAKTHLKMWIFHEHFILQDEDGDPTLGFHAVNNDFTTGGMTDSTAAWGVPHKYHVSVFDKSTKQRYHDDPTIIIGGSHAEYLIDLVQKACTQLTPPIDKDKDLSDDAKKLVDAGCKKFKEIEKQPR
jgi:hypothetical protein